MAERISVNVPSVSEVLRSRVWAKALAKAKYALLYAVASKFIPPFLNNTHDFLSHNYKIIGKLFRMRP